MEKRIQIAFVLILGGCLGTAFWFTLGLVQRVFELKIDGNIWWLLGTTGVPAILGGCILYPKLILLFVALLTPFGAALYGAISGYEIWNEWFFWPVTVICVAVMAYVLLDTFKERTIQSR